MKLEILSRAQLTEINNSQPPEAKYGDVFVAIAEAEQKHTARQIVEWLRDYQCPDCSTSGFPAFVIPIKDWQLLEQLVK